MKKLLIVLAIAFWAGSSAHAAAREHDRESVGGDDTLISVSDGRRWVGHQQSESSFITCYGTAISIGEGDKVVHGASCEMQRATLHAGVQRALGLFSSLEGQGLTTLNDAYAVGRYALAKWTGEKGKHGNAVLVDDGTAWHVLTFGKFDEREALARGVPRDVLSDLLGAK